MGVEIHRYRLGGSGEGFVCEVFGRFVLKEMSCESSTSVFLWKEPVLLITIGTISMSEVHAPRRSLMLFLRGVYRPMMLSFTLCMFMSVSRTCIRLAMA